MLSESLRGFKLPNAVGITTAAERQAVEASLYARLDAIHDELTVLNEEKARVTRVRGDLCCLLVVVRFDLYVVSTSSIALMWCAALDAPCSCTSNGNSSWMPCCS